MIIGEPLQPLGAGQKRRTFESVSYSGHVWLLPHPSINFYKIPNIRICEVVFFSLTILFENIALLD